MKLAAHTIIGFDAKRAARNRTGLGNYSRFVIGMLTDGLPDADYRLYIPDRRRIDALPTLPPNAHLCTPRAGGWQRMAALWRVWGVTAELARDGVDLFHGLSNELPFNIRQARTTRSIVTIHDLIFIRYPHLYRFIDRMIYRCKFYRACRAADRIIAVSECTKRDIVSYFGIPASKIDVVYQGCDNRFRMPVAADRLEAVRKKYDLPDRFILNVGTIEARKNLLAAVEALTRLAEPITLIAIGRRTAYARTVDAYVRANGLGSRVRVLTDVGSDELPAIYRLASTFVYPSFFEGFGIPILEALCCGTPVVAATGSCLEEAGGPASIYVDPHDPAALAAAIEQTLTDATLRRRMIESGLAHAARFKPDRLLNDLVRVYEKTVRNTAHE